MATTPPGWYDDGRGALRWWDGSQWTEHVQTPDDAPAAGSREDGDDGMDALLAPAVEPAPTLADGAVQAPDRVPAAAAYDGDAEGGHAPSAPPGYPGGFPGGGAPSGAFISATEPKKSKLWILWVVLGVVLLGIVILATVLIPIVIGMFGSITTSGTGGGTTAEDEAAAVAAVELYDEAWGTADCDKFEAATTENFRTVLELADCATFTAAAQGFIDSVDDYQISVLSVEPGQGDITVVTSETYLSLFDDDGNPLQEPAPFEDNYAYVVVPSEGGWAINEALDASGE